ncbi:DUF2064 domain-containing protein [soil metagenome]
MTTLVLIAKEPLPGRAKTRLHPPLSLEQAAALAAASIDDTLAALATLPAARRVLLFEGDAVPARAQGYDVVPQTGGGLDERLAAAFDDCEGPTLLIGMDTPQVTVTDLLPAFQAWPHDVDAWFGPATDGGFWALGMREPRGGLIRGVPMSRDDTGRVQRERLERAGLRVSILPTLTDVDTIDSAREVAALAPGTLFARTLAGFEAAMTAGVGA